MTIRIVTLRKKDKVVTTKKGIKQTIYCPGAISIAYYDSPDPSVRLAIGIMFTAPYGNFEKRRASRIATVRLETNCLEFTVRAPQKFTDHSVAFLVRSFLLAKTEWAQVTGPRYDDDPRYTAFMAEFIGQDGVVRATARGIPKGVIVRAPRPDPMQDPKSSYIEVTKTGPVGWVFKCVPRWATDFVQELD